MVTGHIGLAYLARARWPRAELVALLIATALPDLADFVLPQGNQCRTACGMYTHAFPAVLVLAAAMGVLAWAIWHRRITALLAAALVLSHVVLDLVTGHKAFWLGGPVTGLALYRYPSADFALETVIMVACWVVLRRSSAPPRWATHPAMLVLLIALQLVIGLIHSGKLPLA